MHEMSLTKYLQKREKELFSKTPKVDVYTLLAKKHGDLDNRKKKLSREEILFHGISLDEVFSKASAELRIDSHKIKHRIIKQKKNSWFKKGNPLYQVAFNLSSAIEKGVNRDILDEHILIEVDDTIINGYPELDVTKKGKFLIIHPPRKGGKRTDLMTVKVMLAEKEVEGVADTTIKALIGKNDGEPLMIDKWVPDPWKDGKIFCDISDDSMTAMIRIVPPKRDGKFIDREDIRKVLLSQKIKYGVLDEKIDKCLKNKIFNKPIKVAEGIKPVDGKDAYINYRVDLEKQLAFIDSDANRVDLKEMKLITNVRKGDTLAEKKVATKGKNGKNLFNKTIPAEDGKDIEMKEGDNTFIDNSGLLLRSKVDGHVIQRDNLLHVVEIYVINGDVGPKTGNIVKMGSVKVLGSVLDGYSVKASGNIEVVKSVEASHLESMGSIIVKLGINGKNKGKVSSEKGNIHSKFIQNAEVVCGKNIIVSQSIIRSEVNCDGSVILQGGKSVIIGGITRAYKEIRARVLGSPSDVKTRLEVGIMPSIRRGEIKYRQYIEKNREQITQLKLDIKTLEGQSLDEGKKEKLKELEQSLEEIEKGLIENKAKLAEIEDVILFSSKEGKIIANNKVYRGVYMKCNLGEIDIHQEQSASFYKMDPDNNKYVKLYPLIKSNWRLKK